ncbi:MAG: hypothetical protein HWN65_09430 [Candidatus Helarchaeota archaeon]|nr:hypothetical protein [Candidatus Helarchaeota archaeon]
MKIEKDHMSIKNNGSKIRKILIMGLDDAGKTSILLSLQRDTNLLSYCSLRPTQGRVIVSFQDRDTLFTVWDFGGQEQYRTDYFQHLDEYFIEVDKIFFVIDVQDTERYDLAFDYLKIIVEYLVKNSLKVDFTIFLHKFDPNLEDHPDFTEERLSQTLFGKLKEIIPPNFTHDIFKTTIYTIFQKTPVTIR